MTRKTITAMSIFVCTLIGVLIFFLFHQNDSNETLDIQETSNYIQSPYVAATNWQYRFYEKTPIYRESFSIRHIIAQTEEGDFIAEVCWGDMWHPPNIALPGAMRQYQTPSNIMIVDSDFSDGRHFFYATPEWNNFYFAASSTMCYIYILAHTHGEDRHDCYATLYIYNHNGMLVSQYKWDAFVDPLIIDAFVVDNYVIIRNYWSIVIKSKQGEILFEKASPSVSTVGNGYFIGLYEEGRRFLQKIEVPQGGLFGRMIWIGIIIMKYH